MERHLWFSKWVSEKRFNQFELHQCCWDSQYMWDSKYCNAFQSVIQSAIQSVMMYLSSEVKTSSAEQWTVHYFNSRRNTSTADNCTDMISPVTSLPSEDKPSNNNSALFSNIYSYKHPQLRWSPRAHPSKENAEFVDTTLSCCSTDIWDSSSITFSEAFLLL